MTDTSFSVKPINGLDIPDTALAASYQAARHHHYHAPAQVDIADDDGQISCICGYADDDGWTVACDQCNKWQHQICYYPGYEERSLPDELQHYCIACRPRNDINIDLARQRQREKRKHPEPLTNGLKRNASKSHKKKVKEPAPVLPNGLHDKFRHDRNSASPRDQPPPAKRPKTTHRTSDSTTTTTATTTTTTVPTKGHSRKRNASAVHHRRSLSRSPDSPVEQYSEEFLQCYQDEHWQVTKSNLHNSIAVTNALSEWLNAPEEDFRTMHNQAKGEVLMRWDGELEDIPGKAQTEFLLGEDKTIRYQGLHPIWKGITVKETVASGAYIGELKGHVGFKKEYQHDASNRWAQLRHPEPFVFFHPKLPIVIDARHEGTELRYIRRSCMPNARLQILVTDSVDYHFCFMATQQIEPGDEVAVGWDTGDGLPELASRTGYSDDELTVLSGWVSTALANCGPCACQLPEQECKMSRFDRRIRGAVDAQSIKAAKGKKRKMGQQVSPTNTHAVNSRSGSETRKVDQDDDGSESRSTSGSVGRGSVSRDITPNTHYSSNGQSTTIPELSERERKKLAKEEEIFRRQEEEQAGKQAKKKRTSAGSALNTPNPTSSKQLGFHSSGNIKYADASTSRQSGLPSRNIVGRKPKLQKPPSRPVNRTVKRSRPVYVDSSVQCDMEVEEANRRALTPSPRRPFLSTRQRLLELCARNNTAVMPSVPSPEPATADASTVDVDRMDVEQSIVFKADLSPSSVPMTLLTSTMAKTIETSSNPPSIQDIEMNDAPASEQAAPGLGSPVAGSNQSMDGRKLSPPLKVSSVQWSTDHDPSTDTNTSTTRQKSPKMYIQMPPPIANAASAVHLAQSAGSPNMAPGSTVQSPSILGSSALLSPSVGAEKTPTIQKKKMSLSDYKARRMAKDKDNEVKADRESSPASVASGPIVPPLQASSSSEAKAAEGGSAIDDDVSMGDAHEAIKAA